MVQEWFPKDLWDQYWANLGVTAENGCFYRWGKATWESLTVRRVFGSPTHRNTLQRTATHCNTQQHTATHCNTLQHAATLTYLHIYTCVRVCVCVCVYMWVYDKQDELDFSWKERARKLLRMYTDRVHGTYIQEKACSLVWHYADCDQVCGCGCGCGCRCGCGCGCG
jgi:trehalose-6-phosphatase